MIHDDSVRFEARASPYFDSVMASVAADGIAKGAAMLFSTLRQRR